MSDDASPLLPSPVEAVGECFTNAARAVGWHDAAPRTSPKREPMSESKKSKHTGVGPVNSLAELLGLDDAGVAAPKRIHVPQLKRDVYLCAPTPDEADYYEQLTDRVDDKGKPRIVENIRAELVARCLCTAEGEYLAQGRDAITALAKSLGTKKGWGPIIRQLYGEARLLSGLVITQAEVDAEKNASSAAPADASASGSPESGAAPSPSLTVAA